MTVQTNAQAVPRMMVSGYLRAVRLPLTAVELAAKQRSNQQWPPTLAFESFEAAVETVLGSVLGDSALVDKGRLRQAKVAQLRKAAELDTVAAQEAEQAEQRLQARREHVADERESTERSAEQRKREVERQAAIRERKVQEKAVTKATAARQQKATRDKAITRQERAANTAALTAESRALTVANDALEAEETVEVINDTLEGTKMARKTS
jgi:hypothetical protein